ncbi:related to small s protein [Cephalotrichum gorgonifer]|uniref:Related to small s protein n=1 Tax=Cephalotrichum gorgonifer TaxID=2041049 RepID=A0AAE8N2Y8_9PEZI|nr:related to small s protein [Cephalotrichum gorgonifer]
MKAAEAMLRQNLPKPVTVGSHAYVVVTNACRKIGEDLLLRIVRLEGVSSSGGDARVGRSGFRDAWPYQDVEALGMRLGVLYRLCQDDANLSHVTDSIISANGFSYKEDEQPPRDSVEEKDPLGSGSNLFNGVHPAGKQPARAPRLVPAGLLNDFILEGLAYSNMHDREEEVVQAHSRTFEWVFAKPESLHEQGNTFNHQLTTWLGTNELGPIYWVTGKPGSGKSTFMRFLFHHQLTQHHLKKWAQGQQVCTAGFFFWTSGSREQRSQTGLLRSLLHQLLSANTESIPNAFPKLWGKLRTMSTKDRIRLTLDWTAADLLDAFQRFVDAALPRMRLCLFVDGLDEFDGDHNALIDFFKNLSIGTHRNAVRMCLSSRPWNVFETAFQNNVPNLRLQDLTYNDMYRYARDRLRMDFPIRDLLRYNAEAGEILINNAIERADGVFLWMRLAVNEMLKISNPGLSMKALTGFLNTLPTDLDQLFTKLLFEGKKESHLTEAAILFRLMTAQETVADFVRNDSANSLTVWEIAFATRQEDDELAMSAVVEEATDDVINHRCAETVDKIRLRFAGLLALHGRQRQGNMRATRFVDPQSGEEDYLNDTGKRVTYIHRTVRDWLMEADGVYNRLVEKAPAGFDPHLRLLRSYVLRLKNPLEEIEHHRRLDEWWEDIALAMTHARYITVDATGLQRQFLNELDKTLSWHWLDKPEDPYDHWARNAFGAYEARMKSSPIWQPFLCLATKFGLYQYVREEVSARARVDKEGGVSDEQRELERADSTPLLAYATEFLCSRKLTIYPLSSPQLVGFLLQNPSRINPGPNDEYTEFATRQPRTPWTALLRHLRDARRRGWIEFYDIGPEGTARWSEIVRLFIEDGGADVDAVVAADIWDPEITARGVLEMLEETYGAVEIRRLRQLMGKTKGKARAK